MDFLTDIELLARADYAALTFNSGLAHLVDVLRVSLYGKHRSTFVDASYARRAPRFKPRCLQIFLLPFSFSGRRARYMHAVFSCPVSGAFAMHGGGCTRICSACRLYEILKHVKKRVREAGAELPTGALRFVCVTGEEGLNTSFTRSKGYCWDVQARLVGANKAAFTGGAAQATPPASDEAETTALSGRIGVNISTFLF